MEQIEVRILDRNFKLQVPAQERERLMRAVGIVDRKMREIRDAGRAQGTDRIAVNAALQLVYEFLGREAAVDPADGSDSAVADDMTRSAASTLAIADDEGAGRSAPVAASPVTGTAASPTAATSARPAAAAAARVSPSVANKAHTASGQTAAARPHGSSRIDATRPEPAARAESQSAVARDAAKPGSMKREPGKGESASTGDDSGKPLAAARIEEISNEVEAEIRRQENLF